MKLLRRPEWLILGIVCIAANLRAPITSLPTVVDLIQIDTGLSSAALGLLTSLPLFVFALVSLCSASIAHRFGLERSLYYAIWLMLIGVGLRSLPHLAALYVGNNIIAVGIALGNVLLPGLIKRDFPQRIALITSLYALSMGIIAALVSAVTVPIAHVWGWRIALLAMSLMILITLVVWWPQRHKGRPQAEQRRRSASISLWRHPLAWQVSLFLGLNSLMYYIVVSWLPAMLQASGFGADEAASMQGVLQLATAIPGLVIVPLIARFKDQRIVVVFMMLPVFVGLLGLWLYPDAAWWWSVILGFGSGAVFVLALSFVGMRVATAPLAAALSGMAQFIGYLLAAGGPALTGKMHDLSQSWASTLIFCLVIAVMMLISGLYAGRDQQIQA